MTRPGLATDKMSDGWEETRFGGFFVAYVFPTPPSAAHLVRVSALIRLLQAPPAGAAGNMGVVLRHQCLALVGVEHSHGDG